MEYKTVGNLKIPQNLSPEKQAIVDEIARNYAAKNREIDKDNLKNMGRIALGSLVSGASFHPILNIPYVGTGLGGAMYDAGQAIVEGDKLGDIAKRAGRGFAIGETVGAVPYVGKAASKTKAGQAVSKQFDKVAEKVAANPAVQKAYDVLMTDIRAFNPNKQTAYHGSPYDFNKFSNEAIGTGEGAQAHGMGHYAAFNKDVAQRYRGELAKDYYLNGKKLSPTSKEYDMIDAFNDNLTSQNPTLEDAKAAFIEQQQKFLNRYNESPALEQMKKATQEYIDLANSIDLNNLEVKTGGNLYKLSIPKDDVLLRENEMFNYQPEYVQDKLLDLAYELQDKGGRGKRNLLNAIGENKTGKQLYETIWDMYDDADIYGASGASKLLSDRGIKGISYNGGIDGEARVIFNPDDIDIVRKYYNQPTFKDIYNKFINSGTFAGALTNP